MGLYQKNKEKINAAVRIAPELQRYLEEQIRQCGEFGELLNDKQKQSDIDVIGKTCSVKKLSMPCDIVWNSIELSEKRGANGKDARSKLKAKRYEKEVIKVEIKKSE